MFQNCEEFYSLSWTAIYSTSITITWTNQKSELYYLIAKQTKNAIDETDCPLEFEAKEAMSSGVSYFMMSMQLMIVLNLF